MSDITETMTVKNGQAAVKTVTVAGKLSPKTSATDTIALVETSDGKQAALKVYNINGGGGGGGDYDAEIEALENAVSVLTTSVELSTEIGQMTTVLLDELLTLDVDGRPDYKAPGATVYAENGVTGIIDTINNSAQTAVVKTVSVSTGGGAGGDYLPLSGGTLTGKLKIKPDVSSTFGEILTLSYGNDDVVIQKNRYSKTLTMDCVLTIQTLMPLNTMTNSDIGSPTQKFRNVYMSQISSSTSYSDEHYLTVPNKDGTIATVEDIDAAVGYISTALTAILGE